MATIVLTIVATLADHLAGRVRHDRLDATDVVGQAALDLAGAGLGEEAQRHALELHVERVAQVLHDVLADRVGEVRLAEADQADGDGHHDHQADVQVELEQVAGGEHVVDEQLEQERVDEAHQAGQEDRPGDHRHLGLVGREEDGDPADRPIALLRG